jgi:hypothetical protein
MIALMDGILLSAGNFSWETEKELGFKLVEGIGLERRQGGSE